MRLSRIIVSVCVVAYLACALIIVWNKVKGERRYKCVREVPASKRLKYNSLPAKSVSYNIDLVKEENGYALYRYWRIDTEPEVVRGDRGGILYIAQEYYENCNCGNVYIIAHRDYHGKSSKPAVTRIIDQDTEKPFSFPFKITNREDNDLNTFDTTGIGFITPDEFWNNYKYVDWKSKLGREVVSIENTQH